VNRTLALIIAASTLLAAPVLAGEAPAPVAATATTSTAAAADAPPEPIKGTPAENAGAKPFTGDGMWKAFHGREGVHRIVDHFIDRNLVDARIGETFKGHDPVKLKTLLEEQFCYLLNGPCTYTGRDMKTRRLRRPEPLPRQAGAHGARHRRALSPCAPVARRRQTAYSWAGR
jgi:hypothetical protein